MTMVLHAWELFCIGVWLGAGFAMGAFLAVCLVEAASSLRKRLAR